MVRASVGHVCASIKSLQKCIHGLGLILTFLQPVRPQLLQPGLQGGQINNLTVSYL